MQSCLAASLSAFPLSVVIRVMADDRSRSTRRDSVAKLSEKSKRVTTLANQIKDSVISGFGPSRAVTFNSGLMRIRNNLNVVKCKAFYKWHQRVFVDLTASIKGRFIPEVSKSKSQSLAALVLKNTMLRIGKHRIRIALYKWQKVVDVELSQNLLPEQELRIENERLRRKSALLVPTEGNTLGLVRRRLGMMLNNSTRQSVRKAFDRWKSLSRIISYRIEMQRQQIKVDIGMQHIRSEQKKIDDVRGENNKLTLWLLSTLIFMRWKVQCLMQKLSEENDARHRDREIIYERINELKKRLANAQQIERDALATAALRGNEFCGRMKSLQYEFEGYLVNEKEQPNR